MRISDKSRWLAVAALSFCADDREFNNGHFRHYAWGIIDDRAAIALVGSVMDAMQWLVAGYAVAMREAAGLLSDGWSPGDPVVRLRGGK